MKKLALFFSFWIITACNTIPKDDFNYPLRANDITEEPTSPLKNAAGDLRRSTEFTKLSQNVAFKYASADLTADAKQSLDRMADIMKDSGNSFERMRIAGFTDASGDPSRNLRLSQQRADNVRKYLISKGVPASKLESIGMGSATYDESASDRASADSNRRVEFEIVQ